MKKMFFLICLFVPFGISFADRLEYSSIRIEEETEVRLLQDGSLLAVPRITALSSESSLPMDWETWTKYQEDANKLGLELHTPQDRYHLDPLVHGFYRISDTYFKTRYLLVLQKNGPNLFVPETLYVKERQQGAPNIKTGIGIWWQNTSLHFFAHSSPEIGDFAAMVRKSLVHNGEIPEGVEVSETSDQGFYETGGFAYLSKHFQWDKANARLVRCKGQKPPFDMVKLTGSREENSYVLYLAVPKGWPENVKAGGKN